LKTGQKENLMSTFEHDKIEANENFYDVLAKTLDVLLCAEPNPIAQLANASALLFHHMSSLNWLGFYLIGSNLKGTEQELIVGPFQGKPACTRIAFNRGVCGKCATEMKTILVPNVHEFPGHIACDAQSQSEIVLPLISNGKLWGVLDIDSPEINRFRDFDAQGLEKVREVLEKRVQYFK
jgi:L-methionine (R)-S-oxide reductase